MAYIKQAYNSIAQEVADDKAPPRKELGDGDGGWLRPREMGLFKSNGGPCQQHAARAPQVRKGRCREGNWCRDCSPKNFCQHGRQKNECIDCDTGHRKHGRRKRQCQCTMQGATAA
jgi:hypothetical protein